MRDFIGHEALINNFKQRCLKNTLSHAHLIAGEDGVGKGKLANILAKFILNGDLDREYVDIINYSSEKSSFGVDDVRDIIEEVYKKPFEKDKKVIIIYEGNKLTIQAQNALLKTIEEPPKGVYIIILCKLNGTDAEKKGVYRWNQEKWQKKSVMLSQIKRERT